MNDNRAKIQPETVASIVERWRRSNDRGSGVHRLQTGRDALSARLGLIDRAVESIDIQSYLISDDMIGNLIALRLTDAADRGVRVRLLMDDALTESIDRGLLALDGHDNIDVRVFNPFPRGRSRLLSLMRNFRLLTRRMHNKSFTVDRQITIVGGRNIADEYFRSDGGREFVDEDLLAIGPVVDDVADGFEAYWNAPEAEPMKTFSSLVAHRGIGELSSVGRRFLAGSDGQAFLDAVRGTLIDRLGSGELQLVAADASLVMDLPDKIRRFGRHTESRTSVFLQDMVGSAARDVLVVSPYFVPQPRGVEFFRRLVARGVRVAIVTNSLASTNHASVHAVYARYRKPLLKLGVELYELRASVESDPLRGKLTLHSKVACVDDSNLFVGSFNLDPRSLYLNTEMGLAVRSEELTRQVDSNIREALGRFTYRLGLSDKGRLRWHYRTEAGQAVSAVEPNTRLYRRIAVRLMGLLPIESQM